MEQTDNHRAGRVLVPVRILGTGSVCPGDPIPTAQLAERCAPGRDAAELEARTGIRTRHWAGPDDSTTSLAAAALELALEDAGLAAGELRRVILVSSTGADMLIPATANAVTDALGLAGSCDAFDLNNACMGFLSGFDVAARCVATGLQPVAVVVSETLSRYLTPADPRPYLVLADAAAACVLGPGRPGEGVVACTFGNEGEYRDGVAMAHPGLTGEAEHIRFAASNERITEAATQTLRRMADEVLGQAGLEMRDVAWVAPHQPNGSMLRAITALLGAAPEQVVPVVQEIGSVGAGSIPVALDRLRRRRRLQPGDHLLMVGVGAGLSYGAILHRVAP